MARDSGIFELILFVGVGSRDESAGQEGISHYLEHCLLKSTTERTERELIDGLEARKGIDNGQTSTDWTLYRVSIPSGDWEYGVDHITELIAQPGFDSAIVKRERGIVIEEIHTRHQHGRPPTLEPLLYGDHPLSRSVAGTESTVSDLGEDELRAWYDKFYRLDNIVVAFSGRVPSADCVARIQDRLRSLASSSEARLEHSLQLHFGPSLLGDGQRVENDRNGFLSLGYLVEPTGAADLAKLLVAKELLQGALHDEIRTKRGLAYAPEAKLVVRDAIWRLDCQIQVGEFANLPSVLEGVELVFNDLSATSGADFTRAKEAVLDSLYVSGSKSLQSCVERTWALRGASIDLRRALSGMERGQFTASVPHLLAFDRRFLISDSTELAPAPPQLARLILFGLLVTAAGIWWYRRRRAMGYFRVNPIARVTDRLRKRGRKLNPLLRFKRKPKVDMDELERQFNDLFQEQDEQESE